jgi:hypothetical protein
METLSVLRSDAAILLNSIRSSLARIKKLPPDYDFQVPPLIPHVDDYREDLPRLGRYASLLGKRSVFQPSSRSADSTMADGRGDDNRAQIKCNGNSA